MLWVDSTSFDMHHPHRTGCRGIGCDDGEGGGEGAKQHQRHLDIFFCSCSKNKWMNQRAAHTPHTCLCVCQYITHSPVLLLTTPLGMNTDPLPGMLHSTKLNSLRLTTNILAWSPGTCKSPLSTTASTDLCSTNTQELTTILLGSTLSANHTYTVHVFAI